MKLKINTHVNGSYEQVVSGFNQRLFEALSPPFPPVKVIQFDGCNQGDFVVLRLNFFLFKQNWSSKIIHSVENEEGFAFVDQGIELPFFLKSWKHRHGVLKSSGDVIILDDIDYSTGFLLTDVLLFPALYLQFLYRVPVYKRFFRNPTT